MNIERSGDQAGHRRRPKREPLWMPLYDFCELGVEAYPISEVLAC
jgi:hypothetical protein